MASDVDFVEFLCEQISGCGSVRYKKMFGEYMAYLNGKPIFLICNNMLFVKINDVTTAILGENAEQGSPYDGAKTSYIVTDVDDREMMVKLATELEKITSLPKAKKKKTN